MSDVEKRVFEAKLDFFIDTVQSMVGLSEEFRAQLPHSHPHQLQAQAQYGEELERHNEQMSVFIK